MTAITISRQFGAGGSSVARIVSERLGADLIDGNVIGEVARRLQLRESEVAGSDERPEALVDRLLGAFRHLAPGMSYPWRPPGSEEAVDPRLAVVNLTEFETFYPEKRPFFTEGLNIFSFGDSPSQTQVSWNMHEWTLTE